MAGQNLQDWQKYQLRMGLERTKNLVSCCFPGAAMVDGDEMSARAQISGDHLLK
jgi:hypothetical protein